MITIYHDAAGRKPHRDPITRAGRIHRNGRRRECRCEAFLHLAIGTEIAGGQDNDIGARLGAIGGGYDNNIANAINDVASTIAGGIFNNIAGSYNSIGGGYYNKITNSTHSTIAGGGRSG